MGFLERLTSNVRQIDNIQKIEKLIVNVLDFCNIEQGLFETTQELSDRIRIVNQSLAIFLSAADRRIHELYKLLEKKNELAEVLHGEIDYWSFPDLVVKIDSVYNEVDWMVKSREINDLEKYATAL